MSSCFDRFLREGLSCLLDIEEEEEKKKLYCQIVTSFLLVIFFSSGYKSMLLVLDEPCNDHDLRSFFFSPSMTRSLIEQKLVCALVGYDKARASVFCIHNSFFLHRTTNGMMIEVSEVNVPEEVDEYYESITGRVAYLLKCNTYACFVSQL